ncbi:MAG: hypothetical protein IJB79_05340 [Candidatus Gastranaerophilales bacterium]|nr:hypothetical protein [Candidatus Gastranaerophilales bacterium]
MNIRPISFKSQILNNTNPVLNSSKASGEDFDLMIKQAQLAYKTTSTIKKASRYAQKEASNIVYDSIQIQKNADIILAQIIDTQAFIRYCKDKRKNIPLASSYISKIQIDKGFYDVIITPQKISAIKKEDSKTTLYQFDTEERELIYCANNIQKQGYVTSIDSEYFFEDGYLSKFNSGVSKGNFDFINQSYTFTIGRFDEHVLESFSSKIVKTLDKKSTERFFEFSPSKELSKYSRNQTENSTNEIKKELEYSFDDGNLKTFKKDLVLNPYHYKAQLSVEYANENDFYIESQCDSNNIPEYKAICFYQDGKIEGSII